MVFDDFCNTDLILGSNSSVDKKKLLSPKFDHAVPYSLSLGISSEDKHDAPVKIDVGKAQAESTVLYRRQTSSLSAVSSHSNSSVKRERDLGGGEDDDGSARKKLRLTKEQSIILEDSFKQHNTLNPKQKQALAKQLNLRPRQVEIWFQNRRTRTKLKQIEVDCDVLNKHCETLTNENKRLQKELQELKALKVNAPFYMQFPTATLPMCPSCQRIGNSGSGSGGENSSKSHFSMGAKTHFYGTFTYPSAAC